jgi:hypothetical protein
MFTIITCWFDSVLIHRHYFSVSEILVAQHRRVVDWRRYRRRFRLPEPHFHVCRLCNVSSNLEDELELH